VEEVTWRRRIILRGAAFWSVASSLSGAYILGVHKIDRVPFQYTLTPTPESAPLLLHLAAATLAVALAAAALYGSGWMRRVLLAAAAVQAVTGGLLYFGALQGTWAPGPKAAFHAAFAHLMATVSAVAYLKARRVSQL